MLASHVLQHLLASEKAIHLEKAQRFVFVILRQANKIQVKQAIKQKYNLEALAVNIVHLPKKKVIVRGKRGTTAGIKKAMVTVKQGSQIDFI